MIENVTSPGAKERELAPSVTLLVAMRNEEGYIERCLASILGQDYPQELLETFVFDGRSTDNSRTIAERMLADRPGWVVADNPGIVQSNGWNLGIERASGAIIGIVSAHAEIAPDYVSQAVETLRRTGADLVGGPVRAESDSYVGQAISIATSSAFGVGNARAHYTDTEEEVDTVFQGLCWTEVYDRIGRFDLEMVRNQDDELSYRLRSHGGRIVCNPAIRSRYYNRSTLRSLLRQYFDYGFWKVRVMQKQPRQMQARQFVPAVFVTTLAATTAWAVVAPAGALALGIVGGAYLAAAVVASVRAGMDGNLRLVPVLPVVFAALHVSYGAGFVVGLPRWYLGRGRPRVSPHASPDGMRNR